MLNDTSRRLGGIGAVVLVVLFAFALSACGGSDNGSTAADTAADEAAHVEDEADEAAHDDDEAAHDDADDAALDDADEAAHDDDEAAHDEGDMGDMDMGDDEAAHEEGDAHEADEAHEQNGGSVHVILDEWSIRFGHDGEDASLNIESGGDLVIEVHNSGIAGHDLALIMTDLAPDALPVVDGQVDMEAAGTVIMTIPVLPGGEFSISSLPAVTGSYVVICTVPAHYQQGMVAQVTVTE